MGNEIPEDLKPILAEIRGNLRHQDLNEELYRSLRILNKQIGAMSHIIKAFSDLYLEMTEEDERRKWLERIVVKAEREAARLKLDLWFWRPEEGTTLKQQLKRRVNHLSNLEYSVDDTWDLMTEYMQDHTSGLVDLDLLRTVISEAAHASTD